VISGWKEQMGLLREKSVLKKNKPKVFFQEWDEPVITGIQWVSELIEIAGGMDCFEELKEKKMAKDRIVSLDEVGAKNPDIIIGSWCGKKMDFDWVKTRKEWKDTSAIRKNRIFEMDSSIILQPGPALFIDGVQLLEKIINSI
ncbi:MAG: ABC transporter substrate-binding protein, partial [Leptospira sp.]|nr:ABC transporter substrate-binding protein [Leptospira sp.]